MGKAWSEKEINAFDEALVRYGRDVPRIVKAVGTRSKKAISNRIYNLVPVKQPLPEKYAKMRKEIEVAESAAIESATEKAHRLAKRKRIDDDDDDDIKGGGEETVDDDDEVVGEVALPVVKRRRNRKVQDVLDVFLSNQDRFLQQFSALSKTIIARLPPVAAAEPAPAPVPASAATNKQLERRIAALEKELTRTRAKIALLSAAYNSDADGRENDAGIGEDGRGFGMSGAGAPADAPDDDDDERYSVLYFNKTK